MQCSCLRNHLGPQLLKCGNLPECGIEMWKGAFWYIIRLFNYLELGNSQTEVYWILHMAHLPVSLMVIWTKNNFLFEGPGIVFQKILSLVSKIFVAQSFGKVLIYLKSTTIYWPEPTKQPFMPIKTLKKKRPWSHLSGILFSSSVRRKVLAWVHLFSWFRWFKLPRNVSNEFTLSQPRKF